jgi:phage tail sheath protein FI
VEGPSGHRGNAEWGALPYAAGKRPLKRPPKPLGRERAAQLPRLRMRRLGARTMAGSDQNADEYKYIPIRWPALFLEESPYRGTQWVVFEPNDEPLWAQIRRNLGAFMNGLFRQGAFQGTTSSEAYFEKCDNETTTQADRNLGIVNILVGFAPLKPAEFVVLTIPQIAGDL